MIKDIETNKAYWDQFYKNNFKHTPSQFCVCVMMEIPADSIIVELGCGNGRDSLYFASQGHSVVGMDLSEEAIASCENTAKQMGVSHATFIHGDLSDGADVAKVIALARSLTGKGSLTFYSRFVMHSINDDQELALLNALETHLRVGESIYFEFRSEADSKLDKHYGNHYRRYINIVSFARILNERNFRIDYIMEGRGMAKFKKEDPCVVRITATKT